MNCSPKYVLAAASNALWDLSLMKKAHQTLHRSAETCRLVQKTDAFIYEMINELRDCIKSNFRRNDTDNDFNL